MGEYADYLLSDHWVVLRDAALNRVNRKCESCGGHRGLHGHHLIYRTPLTLCTTDDIMALCGRCHDLWHEWQKGTVPHSSFTREMTKGALSVLRYPLKPKPKEKKEKPPKPPKVKPPVTDWQEFATAAHLDAYAKLAPTAPRSGKESKHNWIINKMSETLGGKMQFLKMGGKGDKARARMRKANETNP